MNYLTCIVGFRRVVNQWAHHNWDSFPERSLYCFSIKTKIVFWVTLSKIEISIHLTLMTNTLLCIVKIFAVRKTYRTINLSSRINHFFDLWSRTSTNALNRTQFTSAFHANIAIQRNLSKFHPYHLP